MTRGQARNILFNDFKNLSPFQPLRRSFLLVRVAGLLQSFQRILVIVFAAPRREARQQRHPERAHLLAPEPVADRVLTARPGTLFGSVLLAGACALLLVDLFVKSEDRRASFILAQCVLLACAVATVFVLLGTAGQTVYAFHRLFVADLMSHVLKLAAYGAVSAALVYSRQYLLDRGLLSGEYLTLLLFALLGMMVMMSANSFLTVYLGLELLSLCLYAMVALNRDSAASTEAAMKYFVLGALASGMLLYGMSMIYGATGTLTLTEVAKQVANLSKDTTQHTFLIFGLVFMVSGIAFKLGVVPFHMWIPDVYHGAPTAVTLIIGTGPKLAAFAMAMRLLVSGMLDLAADWQQMLAIRCASNCRVLRKVCGALGDGRGRAGLACGGCRDFLADRCVLLPAHRQADVFRRT